MGFTYQILENPKQLTHRALLNPNKKSRMVKTSSSRYFLLLLLLNVLYVGIIRAEMEMGNSFSFKNFSKDSNFNSEIALYGDAKVVDSSGESLQITGSGGYYSAGRAVYKTPFKVVGENPRKLGVSFSMYFVFSLSNEGDGLAFFMVPNGFVFDEFDGGSFGLLKKGKYKFLGVEFDTFKDEKVGDVNDNHVSIDVGSFISMKSRNLSSLNLKLKSGEKMQSWIDYDANSQRLEVRLSKLGKYNYKPSKPLISCPINLSHMWKQDEVVVGLSASSTRNFTNSTQICNIYSWSFEQSIPPQWIHSQALDPNSLNLRSENLIPKEKKSDCGLKVVGAFIFGTSCGALGAIMVLLVWSVLGSRRLPVVPVDYALPAKQVDCEMTKKIVLEKSMKDDEMKK